MDPVGASIGAVSLLFQVFAGCIQGYQLFSQAKNFEKDYEFFRIRFKTEQYRLLDFAAVAGLGTQDDSLVLKSSNRDVLVQVLDEQLRMMMRFGRLDERLRPIARPMLLEETIDDSARDNSDDLSARFPQDNTLLSKALAFIDHTSKYPIRLRWVIFDKAKVEQLLSRLVASNNFLRELLATNQICQLRDNEIQTSYQIIQLNNKIDQIQAIVKGAMLSIPTSSRVAVRKEEAAQGYDERYPDAPSAYPELAMSLAQLGQFKSLATTIDSESVRQREDGQKCWDLQAGDGALAEVRRNDVVLDEAEEGEAKRSRRVTGWYYGVEGRRHKIWLEWSRMEARHVYNTADGPDPATLRRFRALVCLLRQYAHTRIFRAPPCLGYYLHDTSGTTIRYGLLFQNPPETDPFIQPTSLRDLLGYSTVEDHHKPSLTVRVRLMQTLARAVQKLHAVNWLHKGLCSDNVIFFQGKEDTFDPAQLYLTGFDYSRPETSASLSSSPRTTAAEDLYRHPSVQGVPTNGLHGVGFRKCHDIYSTGVVLSEIALWQPIEVILGLGDRNRIKVRDAVNARERLLGHQIVRQLKAAVGDAAAAALEACLTGPSAFGLTARDNEEDGLVAARLSTTFHDVVVKPLAELKL